MIKITNSKIASLAPEWAPFSGCTIIFERFGTKAEGSSAAGSPAGSLHAALAAALTEVPEEWRDIGFCPLPPPTYHVTVCDLVHAGNLRQISPAAKKDFTGETGRLLAPEILAERLKPLLALAGILDVDTADLAFAFSRIANRNNKVVVAELVPGPEPRHQMAFARLAAARGRLAALLADRLAVTLQPYAPHVSLGYFANKEMAPASARLINALNGQVLPQLRGQAFAYGRPALYLFSDMAHYRRES